MSAAIAPAIVGGSARLDAKIFASPETDRIKGFIGTAEEMTVLAPQKTVAYVRSLTDEELLPLGEKALSDIADDIVVLDEIRQRFRKTPHILGYNGWRNFVEKNSRYSLRTIQNRLAEKNGKDESKANITTGNMYTRPAKAVDATVDDAVVEALQTVNPDVAERVRQGTLTPRPTTRRTTPDQFRAKDYYACVGRGLANAFAGVEVRLKEIAHIKKSDWNPAAEEGVKRLVKSLEKVSKEATEYAAKLKGVLRKNGAK